MVLCVEIYPTRRGALTDAPSCGYDAVNVTVLKVRVNQNSATADTDPGWSELDLNPGLRVDLLTLSNGLLSTLGQMPLPAGHYSQIELVLAANGSGPLYANSVVPTGSGETALTTPSAQQSGLKINADKCRYHRYLLKPVLTVTPLYLSGIDRYVGASIANTGTLVSAQQNRVVIKSTVPDGTAQFSVSPLAPGSYDLVISPAGGTTEVLTSVPVLASTFTQVNTATTAFTPPVSTSGLVSGTVSTATTPIDADVLAEQTLAGGKQIALADIPVDSITGAYGYSLPLASPLVGAYLALPMVPTFTADNSAAARYTLASTSGGVTKTSPSVTLSSSVTTVINFAFP